MLKGYLFDLEEEPVPFTISDTHDISIHAHPDSRTRWERKVVSRDIVTGQLVGGEQIRFLGCQYNGFTFSAQGYVCFRQNHDSEELNHFDRIMFTGKAIDQLSGGVDCGFEREYPWPEEARMYAITPRPWDEINHTYTSRVLGRDCTVAIDYEISYNCRWDERVIGICTPRFSLTFPTPVEIECIPELYLAVYDFFAFLNFRRSILFDTISLHNQNKQGRFERIATVVIRSERRDLPRRSKFETVTNGDIGNKLGDLFACIAERRPKGILDDLFIPENEMEYMTVSPTSFFSCALSFEGEYDRTQERKTQTNPDFGRVQALAVDSVIHETARFTDKDETELRALFLSGVREDFQKRIGDICSAQSNRRAKKTLRYAGSMISALDKVDFCLEEQFNGMLKKYQSIIQPFQQAAAARMGIRPEEEQNLGARFAEYRNSIAHGCPKALAPIYAYVFVLGRCLIYIMILQTAGFSNAQMEGIINKLFR